MKISSWGRASALFLILLIHNQALALEFPFWNGVNGEEAESLSGELIYAGYSHDGAKIYSLDLQSGKKQVLSDWPLVWILSLSGISATRILMSLEEYADPERYDGLEKYDKSEFSDSANKYWIAVYDLLNGELKIVREGKKAAYSREYGKILYYSRTEDALVIASLDGASGDDQVVDIGAKLGYNECHMPIQVSGTEFLYSSYASGSYGVWKYDLKLGEVRHLDKLDCRLEGAVWVDSMKQLLCGKRVEEETDAGYSYILTNLAGDIRKKFNWRDDRVGPMSPVIHGKNSESVLLNRGSLYIGFSLEEGLVVDVYNAPLDIYNLKSGLQKEIISRFSWVSPDAIIWADR